MIVVGADPGKMTGIATLDLINRRSALAQLPAVNAVKYVWSLIEASPVVVCCERYDITGQTARKSPQLEAIKVTGALEYKCALHGSRFIQYARADAKRFATDKKLEEMNMVVPDCIHGMDAARQVIMYLAETHQLPKLKL